MTTQKGRDSDIMKKSHKIISESLDGSPNFEVFCGKHKKTSVWGSFYWKYVDCKSCLKKKGKLK